MSNDPSIYLGNNGINGQNNMNMFMQPPGLNLMRPPFQSYNIPTSNMPQQSSNTSYMPNQFQATGISSRPSMMTQMRSGGTNDYSGLISHAGGAMPAGSAYLSGGAVGEGLISSPLVSRGVTSTGQQRPIVRMSGSQVADNTGLRQQMSRTQKIGSHFYDGHNLEAIQKMQENNLLASPAWFLISSPRDSSKQSKQRPNKKTKESESLFFNENLRQNFLMRIQACLLQPDEPMKSALPKAISCYTELTPLESPTQVQESRTFGLPSLCYKAFSNVDNNYYLLRRFIGAHIPSPDALYLLSQTSEVKHPNIVSVREMFSTEAFGDVSLIFVMDFHPNSTTLLHRHMSDPMTLNGFASPFNVDRVARPHSSTKSAADLNMLPEATAWNYMIQLIQAIRHVHQGLNRSCRNIDPSKILLQDEQWIRLNCFGVQELVQFDLRKSTQDLAHYQHEDLINLGKTLLAACCGTGVALQSRQMGTSIDLVERVYSEELSRLLIDLSSGQLTSVEELLTRTAHRAYEALETALGTSDFLEQQLATEMESGNLLRVACKLQTICERNELGAEREWSEMEDRYKLKLFRDFVFHQTDETKAPSLDLNHIMTALNKLDSGSAERVCLVTRDSQNVMVVTYAELKCWLDESYAYLVDRQLHSLRNMQHMQAASQTPIYYASEFTPEETS